MLCARTVRLAVYTRGIVKEDRILEKRGSGFFFHPFFCAWAAFYVSLSRVWVVVGVIEEGVTQAGRCSLFK